MTQPSETVVVDGDRVDEGRRSWPAVVAALVVGAVIGLLLGGLYGATRPASIEADSALSVLPDPTLNVTSGSNNNNVSGPASLDATAYIQSQLVVINGHQLADTVQEQLGLPTRPSVTATQVGETYVVQVQASSSSRSRALAIARAFGTSYDQLRTRQLTNEIDQLLVSTGRQLSAVQSSLAAADDSTRANAQVTPTQTALQTQYEQLLSDRSSLRASRSQVGSIVTTVSPAAIVSVGLSATVRDALGGLVLGAIVGIFVLIVVRRTNHRVRGVTDLATLGVPALLPVQPRRPLRARSGPGFWRTAPARLLAARLHADASHANKPLVVVGVGAEVGTTFMAGAISSALVGRGPVLLITADLFAEAQPSFVADDSLVVDAQRVPVTASSVAGVYLIDPHDLDNGVRLTAVVQQATREGWIVVVDAGAFVRSDIAVRLARVDAAVTLIVGRGTSTPSDVLAATELFEAEDMTYAGAVLNDVPSRLSRKLFRRRAPIIEPAPTATPGGSAQHPDDDSSLSSLLDQPERGRGRRADRVHRALHRESVSSGTRGSAD